MKLQIDCTECHERASYMGVNELDEIVFQCVNCEHQILIPILTMDEQPRWAKWAPWFFLVLPLAAAVAWVLWWIL